MKHCTTCKELKPDNYFRKDREKKDGLASRCKECTNNREKSLYYTRYKDQVDARNKARLDATGKLILNVKLANPCLFCGEKEPVALAFHHRDPTEKDFNISTFRTASLEKVQKEIDKCVVICHNCHAKVHAGILTL
jgi:hypothetical protein